MEKIKRAYYYFFYKIYKTIEYASEASGGKFWSDYKAGLAIIAIEIWFILSIGVYWAVTTKTVIELSIRMPVIYIPLLIITSINYLAFIHTDNWKKYNKEFDKLSKNKNTKGSWIVLGVVLFIIANLIFSFYLMSQIDWSQYR